MTARLPLAFLTVIAAWIVIAMGSPALAGDLPAGRAQASLVSDGQNPCAIYIAGDAAPEDKAAASDLASFLGKIAGAKFEVRAAPNPLPERGLFVGAQEGNPAEGLEPDAFRIRVAGQRIFVVGGSRQGTLYGVYSLLEEIGCRWWSHDEEDVPSLKTIALPQGDTLVRPPFSIHELRNQEAQSKLHNFVFKSRANGSEGYTGSHTLVPMLAAYAQQHPEIYPQTRKGVRTPNKVHYCYLAPNIAQALADVIEEQIKKRHGEIRNTIYFAGMGDAGDGMCYCPACSAVYKEETWTDPDGRKKPGYSATLLRMINQAAEILEKKHPGVRLGTFAYMSLEAPPATIRPRENVIIRVPRLRHCAVHALAEGCAKNQSFLRNLERWCELAPGRVSVWEYGTSFTSFVSPFPCVHSMAENLKTYHRMGVRGVEIQGNYTSMGGDLAVLKNYVWSKVFWDPKADTGAVLRDFCVGYYGPAAEGMLAYVEALEQSVRQPTMICATEFTSGGALLAKNKEARARMVDLAAKALAAASGKAPYERRVREAVVSLDAMRLWGPGPFEERDGKLIRKDIGEYTFPKAQEVVEYLRNAAPNEWSSGRAARMIMQTYHGGPLVTLTRGDVTVKVAPVLNGQIRQIAFRGRDLLCVENDWQAKGFPMVGSSMERLNTRMMNLAGTPTATRVEIEGDGGISLWGGRTKFLVQKSVELAQSGLITSDASVRLPKGIRGEGEPTGASVTTVFAAGKDPARVRVERLDAENQWQPLPPGTGDAPAAIPPAAALRVTLPVQGCVLIDRYEGRPAQRGEVSYNAAAGTLTTTMYLPGVPPAAEPSQVLQRRIEVLPLDKSAR